VIAQSPRTHSVIVATAGGMHANQPSGQAHVDYLKQVFGFLGITDIRVIVAEGLAMGPEARDAALASARKDITAV
jgi:FMN-dependent NADH-azoreductase